MPTCNCKADVEDRLREQGIEATVTHEPLLVETPYEDLAMTCPHGVTWHTQPTSEQIAKWVAEGVA